MQARQIQQELVTPIGQFAAIDIHGHYGRCDRPGLELTIRFQSASAAVVVERAKAANIERTVVSPLAGLMPRGQADAYAANEDAARVVSDQDGLLQWVIINPRDPRTFDQARTMLRNDRCVGIKIHPEEHLYHIREFGESLFRFAAEQAALVLTHSGDANSLPEDFVQFADAYPEMNLIFAHIGCGYDRDLGHQVRAIQKSRAGNLYADTSSAMSIVPNLIEWATHEVGVERVLFGTDTPLYSASMQRSRIDRAELSDAHKQMILRDNTLKLLRLPAAAGKQKL